MASKEQEMLPLFPPRETRPRSDYFGPARGATFLRDQFTISTWLCMGAVVQGSLLLAIGRLALVPAVALLLYRTLDTYAMVVGFKENKYMKHVITQKVSAQIPDENGKFGSKPASSAITVFLIGARTNHPLGAFGPGFKELGGYFEQMSKDLDRHADEFGFLGMTSWLNASARHTSAETQSVCYFRNVEGLQAFAHGEYHRKGWEWWNKTLKDHPYMSIFHETYDVPAGSWETIYGNSHPSGLATTTYKIRNKDTGKVEYASPIVDAKKGLLRTSAGRMSRSNANEHDGYEEPKY
ncbi:uncharacterized protein RCC_11348 [Ramularia collo-cygni]|uniref:Monooxygenase n=1 Tax=Ramularia collo-cygni TaxID=112498 RepID=A0A2D3VQM5_9PEZI|nr:uncharacterized protein RCC_11348 [Ramularia collo-cygni]CZT25679.1 uncharacterized protein RCC_11348 [Ramularia collo-cygni]